MASHLISFRINEDELEALKQRAQGDESANLIAQRLIREQLGMSTEALTEASTGKLEAVIEQLIGARLSRLEAEVENLKKQLLEPKKIDQLRAIA